MPKERGSQVNFQWSVNKDQQNFIKEVRKLNPEWENASITFYSPLEKYGFKEYANLSKGDFWQELNAVCPEDMKSGEFWPSKGAHWDGLAVLQYTVDGVVKNVLLLFEAKAHAGELMQSKNACKWNPSSRQIIERSINDVWRVIAPGKNLSCWLKSYQLANRIAHAKHLNAKGIPTVVIYVLYKNDYSFTDYIATDEAWEKELSKEYKIMGIEPGAASISDVYKVMTLEAPSKEVLLDSKYIDDIVAKKYNCKKD